MPDPSRGGDHARGFALGAKTVQPAGYSVAMSPLLLVMPRAAAARTPAFGKAGWRLLLPRSAGGPAAVPAGMRVDLPDPSQSAAGMASLIEISRLLGGGVSARGGFTRVVYSTQVAKDFDDPASLHYFARPASPPPNAN